MSHYRLERTELGWIVFVGDKPVLLVCEEPMAVQVVHDADALMRVLSDRRQPALPTMLHSPNLQADVEEQPATARPLQD